MKDDLDLVIPKSEPIVKQEIRDLVKAADAGEDILKLYEESPDFWRVRKRDAKVARLEFLEASSTGEAHVILGGGSNIRQDIEDLLYGAGARAHIKQGEAEEAPIAGKRKYGTTERVLELGDAARRLKKKNPRLSLLNAATELETTVGAIRYAYKMKGWAWERADKIRP